MDKGKFIVFEGGDGSGKSTILDMVYDYLIENNIECIKTREPEELKYQKIYEK